MRYFVQPFDLFGEDKSQQLPDRYYMETLSRVSHIRQHLGRHCFDDNGKLILKAFLKECLTYHGHGGGAYSISLHPGGEVQMQYDIFKTYVYDRENPVNKDYKLHWKDRCQLKIWLDKNDIIKLFA